MLPFECLPNRRTFLKASALFSAGISGLALTSPAAMAADDGWIVGPQPGYSPQIGTLVSMLAFTREQVVSNVKGMSQADLDFLLDAKANTIGALLLHLAAIETFFGQNTFYGVKWDAWSDDIKKKWEIPGNLGEPARKAIKGHDLNFYLDTLHESREKNLAEFKNRDDKWLATLVTEGNFKANNYAKWFHVAEHESNHDGQIKFLKSRLPGAKPASE